MKILFANKFFFLNGGSERVFFQERDFLKKDNCQIIDFSMKHEKNLESDFKDFFIENVDFKNDNSSLSKFKTACSFVHSKEAVNKIEQLIQDTHPYIAHLHNIYHQMTPSIIKTLKKNGVKVVLTLHDSKLICPNYTMLNNSDICTKCFNGAYWNAAIEKCYDNSIAKSTLIAIEAYFHKIMKSYEHVDIFVAPSNFLANIISHRIPSDKIRVIPNGIDTNEFTEDCSDNGYILYYGRISKEKGIATLLRAYDQLESKIPLKILGDGPLLEHLKSEFPNAEFLGYKTGDELKKLISKSSFLVVPSECNENCPMTIIESMASGKPVIGSKIGGIPELIQENSTGLLFEKGNAADLAEKMKILIKHIDLRLKMGKNARQIAEKQYSIETHMNKLIDVYNELVSVEN